MRLTLTIALLALTACRYDVSGVLHNGDESFDAATSADDASLSEPDGGVSLTFDAQPAAPDAAAIPPDGEPAPECDMTDSGHADCNDPDCPPCGPLSVCCGNGSCAAVGLCF